MLMNASIAFYSEEPIQKIKSFDSFVQFLFSLSHCSLYSVNLSHAW